MTASSPEQRIRERHTEKDQQDGQPRTGYGGDEPRRFPGCAARDDADKAKVDAKGGLARMYLRNMVDRIAPMMNALI